MNGVAGIMYAMRNCDPKYLSEFYKATWTDSIFYGAFMAVMIYILFIAYRAEGE